MSSDSETHEDDLGPIDVAVIAYPAGAPMTGEAAPLLLDLIDALDASAKPNRAAKGACGPP